MNAFKIRAADGRILDYRKAKTLDLDEVRRYFAHDFEIKDMRQLGRHVIATINKSGVDYILKLATTEGVGARTEIEKLWNYEFNKFSDSDKFCVPKNLDDGYYGNLYYIIMEKFDGPHLSTLNGENYIADTYMDVIIGLSEHIQTLPLNIPNNDLIQESNAQKWFVAKTRSWYENLPPDVVKKYDVEGLLEVVESGADNLAEKPRHGDFTPWHMIKLKNGKIGLIDGEHAHSHGVEYYDIAYFIQRVFSVLKKHDDAKEIINKLEERNYVMDKLYTLLAARAIGGFNDEFLSQSPNYQRAHEFADFVIGLNKKGSSSSTNIL